MRGLVAASLALLIAGCGGSSSSSGSALVDPEQAAAVINSLERSPSSDALLLTTNRGLFRIEGGEATRIDSHVDTPDGRSPVGRFLAIAQSEDGALVGSGHPDERRTVAGFLGLLRSEDEGRTWSERLPLRDRRPARDPHARRHALRL